MSDRQSTTVSLSPGMALWLGPLVGGAVFAGLYLFREQLRPHVPVPYDDLLLTPVLAGQGVFVAIVVMLAIEALTIARLWRSVARMRDEEDDGWASQARRLAMTSHHPRPRKKDSDANLRALQRALGWQVGQRWLLYAMLALVPAFVGLLVGQRGLRAAGTAALPFLDFFAPLMVGTIEGAAVLLLGGLVHWRARALLRHWLATCEAFAPVRATVPQESSERESPPPPRAAVPVGGPPPTPSRDDMPPGFE